VGHSSAAAAGRVYTLGRCEQLAPSGAVEADPEPAMSSRAELGSKRAAEAVGGSQALRAQIAAAIAQMEDVLGELRVVSRELREASKDARDTCTVRIQSERRLPYKCDIYVSQCHVMPNTQYISRRCL